MSILFNLVDKHVEPTVEVLSIEPFKTIWERDKSSKKDKALLEFLYIEYMASFKKTNPFKDVPIENKEIMIKENIFKDSEYEIDELIEEGVKFLIELQRSYSMTFSYYLSALNAANKLKEFFNTIDLNERNYKSGVPLYKPKDITTALLDTESVIEKLKSLEKKVDEDIIENLRVKGDKKISKFSNPNNFKV